MHLHARLKMTCFFFPLKLKRKISLIHFHEIFVRNSLFAPSFPSKTLSAEY